MPKFFRVWWVLGMALSMASAESPTKNSGFLHQNLDRITYQYVENQYSPLFWIYCWRCFLLEKKRERQRSCLLLLRLAPDILSHSSFVGVVELFFALTTDSYLQLTGSLHTQQTTIFEKLLDRSEINHNVALGNQLPRNCEQRSH